MKMKVMITWLIISLFLCLSGAHSLQDGWIEEAVVFPVPNSNYILTQYQFSVEAKAHSPTAATISPALWNLIRKHNFQTLELTLTRGHWPFRSSSNLPSAIFPAVPPPGLELKVAFPAPLLNENNATHPTTESIKSNQELQALGHALSSIVAASVPTLMEHGVWASPAVGWWRWWLSPKSPTRSSSTNTNAVRQRQLYGALTQEGPCVENFSAWLKLLLCRRSGLAGMLQVESFISAPLHSLQLAIDTTGSSDATRDDIRVILGFTLLEKKEVDDVFKKVVSTRPVAALNFAALSGSINNDVDKLGKSTAPSDDQESVSFSCPATAQSSILVPRYSETKGAALSKNCIAISPTVVENNNNNEDNNTVEMQLCTLTPPVTAATATVSGSSVSSAVVWNLDVSSSMVPISTQTTKLIINALITGPSYHHHHYEQHSSENGSTEEGNSTTFVLLHIMQMVPWEVAVRWHTLRISYDSIPIVLHNNKHVRNNNEKEGETEDTNAAAVVWQNFQPAQPHGNAALIEVLLKLPLHTSPSDTTTSNNNTSKHSTFGEVNFEVEIKKKLLTVFDFPPDASRGIDVPAALVTFVPPPPRTVLPEKVMENKENPYKQYSIIAAALGCPLSLNKDNTAAQGQVPLTRYTSPHLLNLPIPDASMPFNVVCFSSTVMALAFGSALNALFTKPSQKMDKNETDVEEEKLKRRRAIKLKLLRVVVVLLVVGLTAIYMDKDLQRQADAWLMKMAAFWPSAPGSHQPEL